VNASTCHLGESLSCVGDHRKTTRNPSAHVCRRKVLQRPNYRVNQLTASAAVGQVQSSPTVSLN